jgi:K+ transporter
MLTSLNQISPASGNPLSESRLQELGITGKFANWQGRFFSIMANKNKDVIGYFHLPAGRVVEIGTQISV